MVNPLLALAVAGALAAAIAMLFWPRRGLLPRWQRTKQLTARVQTEDALKYIHKCEIRGEKPTLAGIAGTLQMTGNDVARLLSDMEAAGLLERHEGDLCLTPAGREAALHIIRAHRLWERYLADRTGYTEPEWHERAELYEHRLLPGEVDALAAALGNPTHDPHGDPIPDATGEFQAHGGRPLTTLPADMPARIVHIEDEPEAVYAQLIAEGLYPGMLLRVIGSSAQRVRFWANGDQGLGSEHVLAPLLASNISVIPVSAEQAPPEPLPSDRMPLSTLRPGDQATVVGISPRCRGAERRRLMDLGVLPGTQISAELVSPGGDPTAYRIREALIALRKEQAELIHIDRTPEGASESVATATAAL